MKEHIIPFLEYSKNHLEKYQGYAGLCYCAKLYSKQNTELEDYLLKFLADSRPDDSGKGDLWWNWITGTEAFDKRIQFCENILNVYKLVSPILNN